MAAKYQVLATQQYTYLDAFNHVVDGYKVFLNLVDFGETHYILVPTLAPATIQKEAEKLVQQRTDISKI